MFSSVSTRISHPWSAASSLERLRPRGEPRQNAVVGHRVTRRLEGHRCKARPTTSRLLVATSVSRAATCGDSEGRMTPVRTAFFAGRQCPCHGSAQRSGGVSNPPAFRPLPSRGRPGGLLTPPLATCICLFPRSVIAPVQHPAIAPVMSSPFRRAWRLGSQRHPRRIPRC